MPRDDDSFIGREPELEELVRRIESDASVVTIVGAPGVGKSRLGREALRRADITASVVCDVSTARDETGFFTTLARALRVESEGAVFDAITASLRRRRPVVLLDGFDYLVGVADVTVGRLGDVVPDVLWVVTSRQRLDLPGEESVPVAPLEPAEAVALFTARSPVELVGEEAEAAAQLVERLDRNPLAIELAASRLRTFQPSDLLERLDRRFTLLRSRHGASLEQAIAFSWELLDADEQFVLAQCTTFRGGFDLDAAEGVVVVAGAPWVLDVIESLVEKSLLTSEPGGRLGMSESIRAFVERSSNAVADRRHAVHFVELGEAWAARPWTARVVARASADTQNLVAVLDRFEDGEPALAVRAALVLNALLRHRGLTDLHRAALDRGIAAARRDDLREALARLLQARGELGVVTGELSDAGVDSAEAASLARDLGEWVTLARAEVHCAEVERRTGRAADGLSRLDALLADPAVSWSVATRRFALAHQASCLVEVGDLERATEVLLGIPAAAAEADAGDEYHALKRLAYAHYYLGNHEQQQRLNEAALELATQIGDRRRMARARQGLGDAAFARGDFATARREYEVALAEHRELGNEHLTGVLLGNLGGADHRCDDLDAATERYHEALLLHQRAGARPYEAVVNFALGALEHERGYADDAAFHYQRATELFRELGQLDDVIATQVARAWLAAQRDDRETALSTLQGLETHDAQWRAVIDRSKALVGGPRGDLSDMAGPGLAALIVRALGQILRGEPLAEEAALRVSLQGRLVRRFVSAEALVAVSAPARADVVIGRAGEWFQAAAEPVSLRRRKAHRRILHELAGRYEAGGEPLDVYEAFELGWPGESAEPDVAAERVYWVVGVLRRLGLEGVLLTSDAGYYLNPGVMVRRGD